MPFELETLVINIQLLWFLFADKLSWCETSSCLTWKRSVSFSNNYSRTRDYSIAILGLVFGEQSLPSWVLFATLSATQLSFLPYFFIIKLWEVFTLDLLTHIVRLRNKDAVLASMRLFFVVRKYFWFLYACFCHVLLSDTDNHSQYGWYMVNMCMFVFNVEREN